MKATKTILGIITAIVVAGFLFSWMEAHDKARNAAYDAYDTCVFQEYGMSAASYYQQHRVAPPCN